MLERAASVRPVEASRSRSRSPTRSGCRPRRHVRRGALTFGVMYAPDQAAHRRRADPGHQPRAVGSADGQRTPDVWWTAAGSLHGGGAWPTTAAGEDREPVGYEQHCKEPSADRSASCVRRCVRRSSVRPRPGLQSTFLLDTCQPARAGTGCSTRTGSAAGSRPGSRSSSVTPRPGRHSWSAAREY